ncbi:MAG: lysophospholipid acyltransferase family protein [Planctomycetota bacterium]
MQRPLWKRLWYRLTQYVAGAFFRVWFRLRRSGHHGVPSAGPAVLVCNHQSHLDPVLVGVMCRRQICYLARDTLFTGALGPLIRSYDAVPIDREGTGLAGIRATLKRIKQGDAVLLFPEGTRTPDGQLQPLQPGFLALVRRGKAAIVPVGLEGPFQAMPRGALLPRPARIGLCYGDAIPIEQADTLSDEALLQLVEERMRACCTTAARLAGRG